MTGRDRALAALRFEDTDRVPMLGGFIAHAQALRQLSGLDPYADPRAAAIAAAKALDVDLIIQVVGPKTADMSTEMGEGRESLFTQRERPPFDSPEQVRDHVAALPSPAEVHAAFDYDACYAEILADWRQCQADGGEDVLILPYAKARDCGFMFYSSFGYENYYQALALYPEVMEKLFAHSAEDARCRNETFVRVVNDTDLPPFVYIGQDICDNSGPMISPRLLDEIYFPNLAHALEPLNAAGIKKIWHSDGNINPIIDRLLECGINGFQGLQEDSYLPDHQKVHLEALAHREDRWGEPLILYGSLSVRDVLPHGTVEDVRREVERCIDACRHRSGFFLAPTSTVGPDVPIENIIAMYEWGNEYGKR
ncbi:MAG: uroporphyrinogen decarboxylase family protein [Armatimonadia bacterium]